MVIKERKREKRCDFGLLETVHKRFHALGGWWVKKLQILNRKQHKLYGFASKVKWRLLRTIPALFKFWRKNRYKNTFNQFLIRNQHLSSPLSFSEHLSTSPTILNQLNTLKNIQILRSFEKVINVLIRERKKRKKIKVNNELLTRNETDWLTTNQTTSETVFEIERKKS